MAISNHIQTILQSSQNQLEKTEQHKNLATNTQTCLDMLDSVGVASAMGIKAAATSLVELTVARKDSILRKIPNISSDLKEELRRLPLVWETNQPETGDNPGLLFRGRSDRIASDRKLEADKATQQLVLKLQALRSAPNLSKRRPIIDLSVLNTMLWIPSFHMETPESIRTAIQLNDWTVSIDLSDAFLHIPVNVQDRKYLRFAYKGESLQFRALLFGLATSPWLFTQIMIEVKIMALQKGIIIHQYLDDWLIRSQSKQVLLNQTEWLLALCKTLGLRINLEKSELTPRDFIFVGYQYKTQINRVYPTQKRIEQIQQKATLFLNSQALPARQWLSLTGLLTATEKLVPMGKTHMRDLQYCLKRQWKQTETNLNQSVQIDHLARTELRWWYDTTNLIVGAPMHPPNPDIQIFTDSSMEGWGAHTLNLEVSGVWSPNERTLHINNLELRAVVLALKHWERVVIGKTILVASDNSTVVAYINKQGGTVSRSLCMEAKEMLIWCHQREIILRARYIPGKLNALADQLSRRGQILHTEWSLVPGFSNSYATSSPNPCGTCLQQNITRNWKSMHLQCRTQNPKL